MTLKNKKIAVIMGDDFPASTHTFLVRKYEKLVQKGVNLTIFTKGKGNWTLFPGLKDKLILKRLPNYMVSLLFYLFSAFVKSPLKTLELIRERNGKSLVTLRNALFFIKNHYDIIHFEFGHDGLAFEELIKLKKIIGTKFIQTFRGSDINFVPLRRGERIYDFVFGNCDYFHFVSKTLLKRAREIGYNKDNFMLIPSSIDTNYFKLSNERTTNNKDKTILISVGGLVWLKGYEYSLQAMRILKDSGLKFTFYIIGDGNYKEAILQAIQDLDLEDCVFLLGNKDREEVRGYLGKADIFVQASLSEGFGNSFLEASAMELPCVVTDAGGCPEAIIDGKTGFVVQKRNPEALADKIKVLIKNPKLSLKMGKLGRAHVIKNYTLDKQVEDNIRMYEKACSS